MQIRLLENRFWLILHKRLPILPLILWKMIQNFQDIFLEKESFTKSEKWLNTQGNIPN